MTQELFTSIFLIMILVFFALALVGLAMLLWCIWKEMK